VLSFWIRIADPRGENDIAYRITVHSCVRLRGPYTKGWNTATFRDDAILTLKMVLFLSIP